MDAYRDLQQIAITDPLAVTQEEQLLLDELALKRQFNLLQQRKNIAEMQPTMKSTAEIQSRAADIAEPQEAKDINAADFSPAQQKYFATERQAYELSNKTDNDIRKIGVPEKFGLSLFNETFDKSKKSYVVCCQDWRHSLKGNQKNNFVHWLLTTVEQWHCSDLRTPLYFLMVKRIQIT